MKSSFSLSIFAATAAAAMLAASAPVRVQVRTRAHAAGEAWTERAEVRELNPAKTAVIVCDMWDKHWCGGANKRVGEMVPRMNKVLDAARRNGMHLRLKFDLRTR